MKGFIVPEFATLVHHPAAITTLIVAAVTVFLVAVLARLKDITVEATVRFLQRQARYLKKLIFRQPPQPIIPSSKADLAAAAQRLAKIIHSRIKDDHMRLRLGESGLLAVRWQGNRDYGDGPRFAKASDDISASYVKLATGRLVVLGRAGSGKSILVQRLALGLLGDPDVMEYSDSAPIPVIFNMTSWSSDLALDDWLIGQLVSLRYGSFLSVDVARELVQDRWILPIFDGFDEIGPKFRIRFLGNLNMDFGRPMVLTSRNEEYEAAVQGGEKNGRVLSKAAVIELVDLVPSVSLDFLQALSYRTVDKVAGKPVSVWKSIADEIEKPSPAAPAASLARVLKTPLMVALAAAVYEEDNPVELLEERFSSVGVIEDHLLESFVPAIYKGTVENPSRWRPDTAAHAFRYLAGHLEHRANSAYQLEGDSRRQDIAWWQLGNIAMSLWKRSLLCGLASGLVLAIANGIVTSAAVLGADGYMVTPLQGVEVVSGNTLAIVLAFGLVHRFTLAGNGGEIKPSWADIKIIKIFGRAPGERVQLSRGVARRFLDGFVVGSLAGLVGIFGIIIVGQIGANRYQKLAQEVPHALPDGWLGLLATGLAIALVLGVTLGNVSILQIPLKVKATAGPLTLLDANRRLAVRGGALAGVLSGIAMGVIVGLQSGAVLGIVYTVIGGLTIGIGGAISVTAWGQWVLFGRLWLPLTRKLPWRTRAFLDDAHQRGVLRQVGGYYQFRHARLQDVYRARPARRRAARQGAERTA